MSVPADPRLKGKRERLFSWPGLVAIALTIGVVLYLMFPRNSFTLSDEQLNNADALSINYLEILLRADPENEQLRLALTEQLLMVGEFLKAEQVIKPLIGQQKSANDIKLFQLQFDLLTAKIAASKTTDERERLRHKLKLWIAEVSEVMQYSPLAFKSIEPQLAYLSLQQQAELLHDFLTRETDPESRFEKQQALATLYLQQGAAERAAEVWGSAYFEATTNNKRVIANRWLDSLLATGEPTLALKVLPELLADFTDNQPLHSRAVSIALQTERVDLATHWLSKLVALNPENSDRGWQLFDLYLGNGDIASARRLVPQLSTSSWTPEQTLKVARLMDWVGEPTSALKYWRQHARQTKEHLSWQRSVELAMMLGRHRDAKDALLQLDKQRALDEEQRALLVQLFIMLGEFDQAIAYLNTQLNKDPGTTTDLKMLVELYREQFQYDELIALLEPRAQGSGELPIEFLVVLAESYQAKLQPEKAWQLLAQQDASRITNLTYWRMRLQLGQYLEKLDDVALSINRVEQLSSVAEAVPGDRRYMLAQLLAQAGRYREAAPLIHQTGQESGNVTTQLQAVAMAIDGGLWQLAETWIKQIKSPELESERAYYFAQRARIAQHRQHYSEARLAWQQAVQLAPDEVLWKEALTWLLMRQPRHYEQELQANLNLFAALNDNQRYLPLLAWGALSLGKEQDAIYWFREGLAQYQNDWQWLSGMAQALTRAGMHDYAWKIRKRILFLLEQQVNRDGIVQVAQARETRLQLTRQFRGNSNAWHQWHDSRLASGNTEDWRQVSLLQALSWALEEQNGDLVNYLVAQLQSMDVALPGWQLISVALQNGNREELQAVLEGFEELPVADQMIALDRLGRKPESIALGLDYLGNGNDEASERQVRQILVGQRTQWPSGYRIGAQRRQLGELAIQRSELLWQEAFDEWVYWLELQNHQIDAEAPVRTITNAQTDLKFGWQWVNDSNLFQGYLGSSRRSNSTPVNVGLSGRHPLNADSSLGWSMDWNLRPELSSATWLHATEDRLTLEHSQQWFSRLTSFSSLRWNTFDDLAGERLANGIGVDLGATYQLFVQDPAWQVTTSLQWSQYDRSSSLSSYLSDAFTENVTMDAVIPKKFGRVGVATRWMHGEVHSINHTVPSPRWHLAFNLGYQWYRDVTDYGVSMGLGWRIFGDDELGFSYEWMSEDVLGNNNWTLWLSYNRALTR